MAILNTNQLQKSMDWKKNGDSYLMSVRRPSLKGGACLDAVPVASPYVRLRTIPHGTDYRG